MMKWFRFFRTVGFLIVLFAVFLAAIWYGKQLDGDRLSSMATYVFAASVVGLTLALIVPGVKRRWWRRPMDYGLVRRRLGAFYYVVWGVLFLSFVTHMAIRLRALELERNLSAPVTELNELFQAMSTVNVTLIFAYFFLMIGLFRFIQHESPGADEDQ